MGYTVNWDGSAVWVYSPSGGDDDDDDGDDGGEDDDDDWEPPVPTLDELIDQFNSTAGTAPGTAKWYSNIPDNWSKSNVMQLQRDLNAWGFRDYAGKPLAVDGIYGVKTLSAQLQFFAVERGSSESKNLFMDLVTATGRLVDKQGIERTGWGPTSNVDYDYYNYLYDIGLRDGIPKSVLAELGGLEDTWSPLDFIGGPGGIVKKGGTEVVEGVVVRTTEGVIAKGAGKVYNAGGDAALRATRRPVFDNMLKNGVEVNGNSFKLNEHAYNSMFKSGRKDIMPDDIIDALATKPQPAQPGSVQYINPSTGTTVFVNPTSSEIVGIWPSGFGK